MAQSWWKKHKDKVAAVAVILPAVAAIGGSSAAFYEHIHDDPIPIVCYQEDAHYKALHERYPKADLYVPKDVDKQCHVTSFIHSDDPPSPPVIVPQPSPQELSAPSSS